VQRIAEAEVAIDTTAEEVKKKIDLDKQALLHQLSAKKVEIVKQLDNLCIEITQQQSFMDSLKKYSEELSVKGAAGDIARESGALHDRVAELSHFDVIQQSNDEVHSIDVDFTATLFGGNILGEVKVTVKPKGEQYLL
jgi:hypothetical protein